MAKKMADLYQRLLFSSAAIVAVASLIFFSHHVWVNCLLVMTIAALAGVGVWEYAQLAKAKGLQPVIALMIAVTMCEVVAFYVSITFPHWSKLALLIIVLGFISFFIAHFNSTADALQHVAVELFGVCYLAIPLSFMLAILYLISVGEHQQDGRWWLFYLITVTKMTDVGGYFAGKLFGKHPLAPQLSPKKTVEGAIGGFIAAIALSLVFALCSRSGAMTAFHLHLFDSIWMGLVIGALAQIGDLAESLLKRDAFVKDSNSLPGFGGVLDMLDSLLFTSPVVYFFIHA